MSDTYVAVNPSTNEAVMCDNPRPVFDAVRFLVRGKVWDSSIIITRCNVPCALYDKDGWHRI